MPNKDYRVCYVNEDSWKQAAGEILSSPDDQPLHEAVLAVRSSYYADKALLAERLSALEKLALTQFGGDWFAEGVNHFWTHGDDRQRSQSFVADIYASGSYKNGVRIVQGYQLIA